MNVPKPLTVTTSTGARRTVEPIDPSEVAQYHRLGTGCGVNFGQTYLQALNHCPEFADRVVGFRVVDAEHAVEADDENLLRAAQRFSEATGYHYVVVSYYERRS